MLASSTASAYVTALSRPSGRSAPSLALMHALLLLSDVLDFLVKCPRSQRCHSLSPQSQTLKLQLDVEGDGKWSTCFYMPDVYLPTGYFLGFSAVTGDLADNHEIIYIQTAEPPKLTVEEVEEMQRVEKEKVRAAERLAHLVVVAGPGRAGMGVDGRWLSGLHLRSYSPRVTTVGEGGQRGRRTS